MSFDESEEFLLYIRKGVSLYSLYVSIILHMHTHIERKRGRWPFALEGSWVKRLDPGSSLLLFEI